MLKSNSDTVRRFINRKKGNEGKSKPEEVVEAVRPKYIFSSITHAGKVRENNEDCLIVSENRFHAENRDISSIFAAVADGLGGMKDGEKASYMAVTRAFAYFIENASFLLDGVPYDKVLVKALNRANTSIRESNGKKEQDDHMATTLTLVAVSGDRGYFVHSGDCTIMRVNSRIESINRSHRMPKTNQIYSCLGITEEVEVDTGEFKISSGDTILMCSDGLTDMVTSGEIKGIVSEFRNDPEKVCSSLVEAALNKGGRDNISIIDIYCTGNP